MGDPSFLSKLKHVFFFKPSKDPSSEEKDYEELVAAALDELQRTRNEHSDRETKADAVSRAVEALEGQANNPTKNITAGTRLDSSTDTPCAPDYVVSSVQVDFQRLTIDVQATTAERGNPSVLNSIKNTADAVVGCCQPPPATIPVLKNVSGTLRPGTITLLLGPPASGKSLFMRALAGRLNSSSKDVQMEGAVKYNGIPVEELEAARIAGVVLQQDSHIANLSVLETTEFAAECLLGKGDKARAVGSLRLADSSGEVSQNSAATGENSAPPATAAKNHFNAVRRLRPQLVLNLLGLANVADTIVGDQQRRGVSGGEKRRTTLAEELAGARDVFLMDEISTGLDSATTFNVVQMLAGMAHVLGKTVLVSMLQPQAEVFHLFDDVLLLMEGRIVYDGPTSEVLRHFESLGFSCPPRKDPASFLLELYTPEGQAAYADPALLTRQGLSAQDRVSGEFLAHPPERHLINIADMESSVKFGCAKENTSSSSSRAVSDIKGGTRNGPCVELQSGTKVGSPDYETGATSTFTSTTTTNNNNSNYTDARGAPTRSWAPVGRYARHWSALFLAVFRRQIRLDFHNRAFILSRLLQLAIMGIIYGTLFSIQEAVVYGRNVLGLCTSSIVNICFSALPQTAIVLSSKPVVLKQRDARFFSPAALVFASAVPQILIAVIECIVYTPIVYFLAGFYSSASYYFVFYLVAWSTLVSMVSVFRFIAYATSTPVACNSFATIYFAIALLTNGFFIVYPHIPDYIVWLYWINPLSWAIRALAINELCSPKWSDPSMQTGNPTLTQGVVVLLEYGFFTERYWIWAGIGFLWVNTLVYLVMSAVVMQWASLSSPRPVLSVAKAKAELSRRAMSWIERHSVRAPGRASSRLSSTSSSSSVTLVCRALWYYIDLPGKRKKSSSLSITKEEENLGGVLGAASSGNDSSSPELANLIPLLRGVSFYAEHGTTTAILGGTGAGKTTLMDVILGRKTQGTIRGEILVNGHPKQQSVWTRIAGYVEQQDIHTAQLTVKESVQFSARLRLPESRFNEDAVKRAADDAIRIVGLEQEQGRVVGAPSGPGLSFEQKKRLSIAVELVAKPVVLCMDEPTSGLDAAAAAAVLSAIHNIAKEGRTVICTIHQPSAEAFEAFDRLLLLHRGGKVAYFGPIGLDSADVVTYFHDKPGVAPILPGYNPASWILEVTGGAAGTVFSSAGDTTNFPAVYAESALYFGNKKRAEELVHAGVEASKASTAPNNSIHRGEFATTKGTQRKWLIKKYWLIYWRTPEYNFVRLLVTLLFSVLYGATYLGLVGEYPQSIAGVQGIIGLIFMMSSMLGVYASKTVQPTVSAERAVFYREHARGMYGTGALSLSSALVELPWLFSQALIMSIITYWMAGFQPIAWKFFYFLLMYFLNLVLFCSLGTLCVYATPSPMLAQLILGFCTQIFIIFGGFLAPYPLMAVGWQWLNRLVPLTWLVYGVTASQLSDNQTPMTGIDGQQTTVAAYVEKTFGYAYGLVWWCPLILFAHCVFLRVSTALLLRRVSFLKR